MLKSLPMLARQQQLLYVSGKGGPDRERKGQVLLSPTEFAGQIKESAQRLPQMLESIISHPTQEFSVAQLADLDRMTLLPKNSPDLSSSYLFLGKVIKDEKRS